GATRFVIDPALIARQGDLAHEAVGQGLEAVLDPRSIDLSTPAGFELSGVQDLPWAPSRPHTPDGLRGASALLFAEELAEFAVKEELSGLLAPTHVVSWPNEWSSVDRELVLNL